MMRIINRISDTQLTEKLCEKDWVSANVWSRWVIDRCSS